MRRLLVCSFVLGIGCLWSIRGGADKSNANSNEAQVMILTARYLVQIHSKVQKKWDVKGISIMELNRRAATVRLWIKANGQLARIRVVSSSDFAPFDRSLLSAIAKAAPYPLPPPLLRQEAVKKGFEILFRRRVFLKKQLPLNTQYKSNSVLYNWQKNIKKRPKPRSR